jgi:hypothetical protein
MNEVGHFNNSDELKDFINSDEQVSINLIAHPVECQEITSGMGYMWYFSKFLSLKIRLFFFYKLMWFFQKFDLPSLV